MRNTDPREEIVREYEIAIIYHPDLEIDLEKAEAKITKIFADHKGTVEKTDNWGKRKLAYPIQKQDNGVYVFYRVSMPGENVAKLDQMLNITSEVIRHLIVKPGPEPVVTEEATDTKASEEDAGEE